MAGARPEKGPAEDGTEKRRVRRSVMEPEPVHGAPGCAAVGAMCGKKLVPRGPKTAERAGCRPEMGVVLGGGFGSERWWTYGG